MKYFFMTLFLGFSAMLYAQNSINGTVTDHNGKSLQGVSIHIREINRGTSTNDRGSFEFANLPKGTIEISFIKNEFYPAIRKVTIGESPIALTIVLEPTLHQIDEVIVSTAFNRLQSQNVMKVEQIGIDALQKKGAFSAVDGLTTVPGVSQLSTGVSIGKPVIRGLSGNRVLVYANRIRMENQQFGDEHGLGLNSQGFESVEIIKGPASLLYGSDALGGVIYFNPEKYADNNEFDGDFSQRLFSNTNGTETSIGLKTSGDKVRFLVRGTTSAHSDYQVPSGDRVVNTRFRESDFKGGISFSDRNFSTDLRYNYNTLAIGIPEGDFGQSTQKRILYPNQSVRSHMISSKNTFFLANSKLDATFGFTSNRRKEFEEAGEAELDMKLNTLSYDVRYSFPQFGKIELISGIQGMYQTNENFGHHALIPDANTIDLGAYATAMIDFDTKNALQIGVRLDNRAIDTKAFEDVEALSKSYTSFNASLGYKTNIAHSSVIRLNVASGFRAPNLAELTSHGTHEGSNRYELGNPDLKSEQNIQADLNFEYEMTHVDFFVNGFYNHVNNFIYTSPQDYQLDDHDVFAYTQDDAKLYGGEIGLHLHPHPLDWLHIESSFETVTGKKQNGDYLPLMPANTWTNALRTEFSYKSWLSKGFARIEVAHTFEQNNTSINETASEAYTSVNVGMGGTISVGGTPFDLHISANNLFDQEYIPHLSRLKADDIPNIGRNIILGINFEF